MRNILESHPLKNLREAVKNSNIRGYSKMKKSELIDEMMKPEHKEDFKDIKMYVKPERAKPVKKSQPKKSQPKKSGTYKLTPEQSKNLKLYYGKNSPNPKLSKELVAGNILRNQVLNNKMIFTTGSDAALMMDHKRILLDELYKKSQPKKVEPKKEEPKKLEEEPFYKKQLKINREDMKKKKKVKISNKKSKPKKEAPKKEAPKKKAPKKEGSKPMTGREFLLKNTEAQARKKLDKFEKLGSKGLREALRKGGGSVNVFDLLSTL